MTISHRPIDITVHGGDEFVDGISHVEITLDEHNHLTLNANEWRDLLRSCASWVEPIPRRRWWQRRT